MAYVGEHRGDYIQELSYRFVGDGKGEFEVVAPPPPKPKNNNVCLGCMLLCLLIFGIAVYVNVMTQHKPGPNQMVMDRLPGAAGVPDASIVGATPSPDPVAATLAGLSYPPAGVVADCDPKALHSGAQVQAAFDIAFRPTGLVVEGSYGTVSQVIASAADGHQLVVDWRDFPALQGSMVSRAQLLRALSPGDAVSATTDIVVERDAYATGSLSVDDLVLAAKDIDGRVPRDTYGYVVSVIGGQAKYLVNFPEFPQLADTKLNASEITKAPLVGDKVEAKSDIDLGVAGMVMTGANGTVAAMSREGTTYKYAVRLAGIQQKASPALVSGLQLRILRESSRPAPIRVVTGTPGQVVSSPPNIGLHDSMIRVNFNGLSQMAGLNVSRDQVERVPNWSDDHRTYCCSTAQVGCRSIAAVDSGEPFGCNESEAPNWSGTEHKWCCRFKQKGCPLSAAAV